MFKRIWKYIGVRFGYFETVTVGTVQFTAANGKRRCFTGVTELSIERSDT